jgi:hypothetical protein
VRTRGRRSRAGAARRGCTRSRHGNPTQFYVANLCPAFAAEKAVAVQRAADVRKKLRKDSLNIDGELSQESGFLVGQWLDGDSRQQ